MGAVTYPEPRVIEMLNEHFACIKFNTQDLNPDGRKLLHEIRLLWEPGLVFRTRRGTEIQRVVGYRPPDDFLALLHLALGKVTMGEGDFGASAQHFQRIEEHAPNPEITAEAMYWTAIAIFRRDGGEKQILEREWARLEERYPDSVWWKSADVFRICNEMNLL